VDSLFKRAIVTSGIVNQTQWDYCLRLLRHRMVSESIIKGSVAEDRVLKAILVEQGALTEYQADQLMEGRHQLTLGPYIITDFIGQGGMGQVFKAVHQILGRECAIKVLPLQKSALDAIAKEGFMREIQLQAKLDSKYLVRAYDAGQDRKVHYLVTEYVPGMDLRKLVKSQGALSQSRAAQIIMQAALGLDYAHQQGMVHRDVKPGNILVTPEGHAKVSDVGLAAIFVDSPAANFRYGGENRGDFYSLSLVDDPRAGKILGTADYLSPEQIKTPLEVGPVSDVYSLGCTLYYAVCAKVPFPGGDTATKLRRHLEEIPMHPRRFATGLHDDFVDIVAEMLEKDVHKRVQTCAEVAARLEPWVNQEWTSTSYPTIAKSPWAAPPPPAIESDQSPLTEDSLQETSQPSNETGASQISKLPPSPSLPSDSGMRSEESISEATEFNPSPSLRMSTRMPHGMTPGMFIALTAAVLVPPALVIGAILGYLIAARS
jgi:serine/threonine protein kinase